MAATTSASTGTTRSLRPLPVTTMASPLGASASVRPSASSILRPQP